MPPLLIPQVGLQSSSAISQSEQEQRLPSHLELQASGNTLLIVVVVCSRTDVGRNNLLMCPPQSLVACPLFSLSLSVYLFLESLVPVKGNSLFLHRCSVPKFRLLAAVLTALYLANIRLYRALFSFVSTDVIVGHSKGSSGDLYLLANSFQAYYFYPPPSCLISIWK